MALSYAGYAVMDRYWYQGVETSKFETVSAPAEPRAVEAVPIAEGGVIGEIEVPRLGLKAIVVQGDSEKLLRRAVGHLPETALAWRSGKHCAGGPSRRAFPAAAQRPAGRHNHFEDAGSRIPVRSGMDCGRSSDGGAGDPADERAGADVGYVLSVLLRRSGAGAIHRSRAQNRGCTKDAERALNEQSPPEGPEFKQQTAIPALYDVNHILT